MPTDPLDSLPSTLPLRINVVGNTGTGKSTLASQLAEIMGCRHVELDALHWEAHWTPAPLERFRARTRLATEGECWVIDGNYRKVRDLIDERLQMLVWLDYPLTVIFWRLTRRNLKRIATREDLWGTGNRETFRSQFLSRDSLYTWAIKTHQIKRQRYQALMADPHFAHIQIVHLRSPGVTNRWLSTLRASDAHQS